MMPVYLPSQRKNNKLDIVFYYTEEIFICRHFRFFNAKIKVNRL